MKRYWLISAAIFALLAVVLAACLRQPAQMAAQNVTSIDVVTLTATGSAGAATGTGSSSVLSGELLDVYFDYGSSITSTTDITMSYSSLLGSSQVLTVTNSSTDALYVPRQTCVDKSGVAISNSYATFPLTGKLDFTVTQSTSGTVAVVYIRYRK